MLAFSAAATLTSLLVLGQPEKSEPVTPAEARGVVEKSLPFLREEGIRWIQNRQCHSCHHVGFMVWSLNDATRLGMKVDQAELKRWTGWAIDYATYKGTLYQMQDPTFNALKEA